MFIVKSVRKKWLYRAVDVSSPIGSFEIVYNGHGLGYETIWVNGEIAARKKSFYWYVPEFEFITGQYRARIKVSISLLFQIKKFKLEINGYEVHSE